MAVVYLLLAALIASCHAQAAPGDRPWPASLAALAAEGKLRSEGLLPAAEGPRRVSYRAEGELPAAGEQPAAEGEAARRHRAPALGEASGGGSAGSWSSSSSSGAMDGV